MFAGWLLLLSFPSRTWDGSALWRWSVEARNHADSQGFGIGIKQKWMFINQNNQFVQVQKDRNSTQKINPRKVCSLYLPPPPFINQRILLYLLIFTAPLLIAASHYTFLVFLQTIDDIFFEVSYKDCIFVNVFFSKRNTHSRIDSSQGSVRISPFFMWNCNFLLLRIFQRRILTTIASSLGVPMNWWDSSKGSVKPFRKYNGAMDKW